MSYQPTPRPPYFDWRLDRWKIGLAVLVWLGLIFSQPPNIARPDPQGASPIARPGQRPQVGVSVDAGDASLTQPTTQVVSPLPEPGTEEKEQVRILASQMEGERQLFSLPPPTFDILESGQPSLSNSTPLFFGQAGIDHWVEVAFDGKRFVILADHTGYWHFVPPVSLPTGITWLQARQIEKDGTPLSEMVSTIALIDPGARPIAAPGILVPPSMYTPLLDSTPLLTGSGPAGMALRFYAQPDSGTEAYTVGEATVDETGTWRWQMSAPLNPGRTTLWAVITSQIGLPVSRSWPLTLEIAVDATPSVNTQTPIAEEINTTR